MAFNGAGQFLRQFSWTNDAANGLDISSARMDQEMDGFAAGLSNCLTRDGQSPPTAAIPFGGQNITGVGRLSAVSMTLTGDSSIGGRMNFGSDVGFTNVGVHFYANATTFGLYDDKNARVVGFYDQVNNVYRFVSALTVGGSTPAKSEGQIFSGAVGRTPTFFMDVSSGLPTLFFDNSSSSALSFDGTYHFALHGVSALDIGNAVNALVPLQQNGNQVWHAGNFNPPDYQPKLTYTPANRDGDTFPNAMTFGSDIRMGPGALHLYSNSAGGGLYDDTNGRLVYYYDKPNNAFRVEAPTMTRQGNQVWDAGNLNPNNYQPKLSYTPANQGGDTFGGDIKRDPNFGLGFLGSNPAVFFNGISNCISFDRTNNKFVAWIGGNAVMSVDANGNMRVPGNVTGSVAP